jgi:ABC-type phosphate transport system substrate-binding protein
MPTHSVRRLASSCVISAAAVAALALPSAALAGGPPQCSGESPIKGQGSTAQNLAQTELWTKKFNISANESACNGTQGTLAKPLVEYTGTGSGPGMEAWGLKGHAVEYKTFAYVGTDQPPSLSDTAEIDKNGAPGTLLTIPVLQFAVAIPIHLPANCTATSKAAPGRLVLDNTTLEEIFRGVITKWSEITEDNDKVSGTGCNPAATIERFVRLEGSGTTATFKKYLYLINKGAVDGGQTWEQLAEAVENTEWPSEGTVGRGKGGKKLAEEVAATESSIGYANLADVRKTKSFSGTGNGAGSGKFWAEVESNGVKPKGKYADPATNGDAEALGKSNCVGEKYTNGSKAFPPKNALESWSEVTTSTKQKKYSICGFTYDLSFTHFGDYPGTTPAEAQAAKDYLQFEVNDAAEGGQQEIEGEASFDPTGTDYLALPTGSKKTNVLKIAEEGAALIGH